MVGGVEGVQREATHQAGAVIVDELCRDLETSGQPQHPIAARNIQKTGR